MENSLGLDVHGAAESQDQGQLSDTTRSTASLRVHRQEDTAVSWGVLANTAEQDGSKGATDSWGPAEAEDSWGPAEAEVSWGPAEAEDSWGSLEEASTTVKDDISKKDRDDSWGTLEEEGNTTQKDDKSKKEKGTPYVPAAPPTRVSTRYDFSSYPTDVFSLYRLRCHRRNLQNEWKRYGFKMRK